MLSCHIILDIRRPLSHHCRRVKLGNQALMSRPSFFGHRDVTCRASNECIAPAVLVSRSTQKLSSSSRVTGGEPITATQGVLVGVQLPLIGYPLPGQTFPGGDSVRCGSLSQNNLNTPAGADLSTIVPSVQRRTTASCRSVLNKKTGHLRSLATLSPERP